MANTDFKIVDHLGIYPASQYDFTFPSGWAPVNENQTAMMKLDRDQYPFVSLSQIVDYGIGEKPIVLQGEDLDDGDQYTLLNAISNPRIKKLYLGEDWFYYVRGIEPRLIRDASLPTLYQYTAAFVAVDPFMYYDATGDILNATASAGTLTVDLSSDGGEVYLEPIFWISGTTTEGTIEDHRGCKLTFDPPTSDTWIILPYFNSYISSFLPDYPIAYKLQNIAARTVANFWALDAKVEGVSTAADFWRTTDNYKMITELTHETTTPTRYDDYSLSYMYPRAENGRSNAFTVTGFTSGTIKAQWKVRR